MLKISTVQINTILQISNITRTLPPNVPLGIAYEN